MPSQMAWSEPTPSYGYGPAYPDSGFNAEIPQPLSHGMSAMLWHGIWKHGKPKHLDLSNSSVIPIGEICYTCSHFSGYKGQGWLISTQQCAGLGDVGPPTGSGQLCQRSRPAWLGRVARAQWRDSKPMVTPMVRRCLRSLSAIQGGCWNRLWQSQRFTFAWSPC